MTGAAGPVGDETSTSTPPAALRFGTGAGRARPAAARPSRNLRSPAESGTVDGGEPRPGAAGGGGPPPRNASGDRVWSEVRRGFVVVVVVTTATPDGGDEADAADADLRVSGPALVRGRRVGAVERAVSGEGVRDEEEDEDATDEDAGARAFAREEAVGEVRREVEVGRVLPPLLLLLLAVRARDFRPGFGGVPGARDLVAGAADEVSERGVAIRRGGTVDCEAEGERRGVVPAPLFLLLLARLAVGETDEEGRDRVKVGETREPRESGDDDRSDGRTTGDVLLLQEGEEATLGGEVGDRERRG